MIKKTKKCSKCGKVIPALSTYIQTPTPLPRHAFDDAPVYYCSVSCFLSAKNAEIIDPKMETLPT